MELNEPHGARRDGFAWKQTFSQKYSLCHGFHSAVELKLNMKLHLYESDAEIIEKEKNRLVDEATWNR